MHPVDADRNLGDLGRFLLGCRAPPYIRQNNSKMRFSDVHVRYYAVAHARLSVVCRLSVTLVHPTQAVVIFVNFSTAFGTLAIL